MAKTQYFAPMAALIEQTSLFKLLYVDKKVFVEAIHPKLGKMEKSLIAVQGLSLSLKDLAAMQKIDGTCGGVRGATTVSGADAAYIFGRIRRAVNNRSEAQLSFINKSGDVVFATGQFSKQMRRYLLDDFYMSKKELSHVWDHPFDKLLNRTKVARAQPRPLADDFFKKGAWGKGSGPSDVLDAVLEEIREEAQPTEAPITATARLRPSTMDDFFDTYKKEVAV